MTTVRLTVNGEACSADVPGRTQLAELLRDHLHLTGTHLGCEHGVCGACTVLVDGRPIRACITYAHACEGVDVVTVEGLGDDPTGRALREAFARHHALQCGFCTPGMLIAAWDIVNRLAPTSEAAIRHELSGNLCRCTGYMGIVAAVREVAARRRGVEPDTEPGAGTPAVRTGDGAPPVDAARPATAGASPTAGADAFRPFEVDPIHLGIAGASAATPSSPPGSIASSSTTSDLVARPMTREDGWTSLEREFATNQPLDALWALFDDLPSVAACLPGVRIESSDATRFTATAAVRFGPIAATFDGEGTRETDIASRSGTITGRGKDARGSATLDATLHYAMSEEDVPASAAKPQTRIRLAIRFRLQGGLAQFNRADLVESFADVVLADFVDNCERALAGEAVRRRTSGFAMLWRMLRAKLGLRPTRPST